MPDATDYVHEYANVTFDAKPFGDADNIALCGILYVPVENVVTGEFETHPQKTITEVCRDMYALHGNKLISYGLLLNKKLDRKFQDIGSCPRFGDLRITACRSSFDEKEAMQFGAATILLPDGTVVIHFRGTDDTLAGWREDLNILLNGSIPSHKKALDYLKEAAEAYDGDIILAGHSKGGHLALYTALNCSEEIRKRIIRIYNNEGPGFANYEPIRTQRYRELLPKYRHLVPNNSFVGMLLAHDRDYTVVKSNRLLGPVQHDLGTWQIKNGEIVTCKELSLMGRITELSLIKLLDVATREQMDNFAEVVCTVCEATGQTTLLNIAKNQKAAINGAKKAFLNMSDETKEQLSDNLKLYGKIIIESYNEIKGKTATRLKKATD